MPRPRIGSQCNNPSFGYGGYCLPKDTKQLLDNYVGVPQNFISAIVETNKTRKRLIADEILKRAPEIESPFVGMYRLTMKHRSDNFRESPVQDVLRFLRNQNIELLIFEPSLNGAKYRGIDTTTDLHALYKFNLVIANRWYEDLV